MSDVLTQFDEWLKDDSDVAALVMRQWLEPVEGKDAVIFPPTYPIEQGRSGYNIDEFKDGTNVCQVDSVGSQANRMEPIFKGDRYRHLVPQVIIRANADGDVRDVHLLDAGHRAADAIVRFSTLGPELFEAFHAFQRQGNAEKLARIAPTSIVFGSWDSRATQAKLPRIVRSVIRAINIQELSRSAQYSTIAGEILEGPDVEVTVKGPKAELGLAHVPAVKTHGGIRLREGGEIRREAVLNLVPLRALRAESTGAESSLILRRYILGLALVALTAPPESFLREGCLLVPDRSRAEERKLVKHDGSREDWQMTHDEVLDFANAAAMAFGVQQPARPGEWDGRLARAVMELDEKRRKELLRAGPVTRERLEQIRSRQSAGARGGRHGGSGTPERRDGASEEDAVQ